jgi:hypothetical protein
MYKLSSKFIHQYRDSWRGVSRGTGMQKIQNPGLYILEAQGYTKYEGECPYKRCSKL